MIYELAVVARPEVTDEEVANFKNIVEEVVKSDQGEMLISDDWGTLVFAQPTARGKERGRYVYYLYRAGSNVNRERERRFRINDHVLKTMIVKVGDDVAQEKVVKSYCTPYSKAHRGSQVEDTEGPEGERDRRRFARKKNCWFSSSNIVADWKDPATFLWLVNEFGKISPARISGINRKNQKIATATIKRARQIGIISYQTNAVAERA